MRAMSKLLALALTATMQSAMAGAVTLDFEDVTTSALLTNQYASKGVTVTGTAWTAVSEAGNCGGDFSFQRDNSCGAVLMGSSMTLNAVAGLGFSDAISFFYSGSAETINLAVHAFDENGVELGQPGLSGKTGKPCGGFAFCNWTQATLTFSGVARTVVFSGADQSIMFDDLSFKTVNVAPPGRLPEPASVALTLAALGGLGWVRRRAAR